MAGDQADDAPGLRRAMVQTARRGLCLVQSASDFARRLVRRGIRQRHGDQSRLGEMAAAQSDQPALVRRVTAAALSRRARGEGPRPRAAIARCGSSSPSSAGFPGPPFSARCSKRSAARTSRWRSSSASIRSIAAASPSCWRRCASTASRLPPSISASSATSISSSGFSQQAATPRHSSINARKGTTSDGIPYIVEFAFGLHQSGLTQGRAACPASSSPAPTGASAINNPFRAFGSTGEGLESTLAKVRANASQPVICALHLASAYIQYADRGKSSIILTDDAEQPDD